MTTEYESVLSGEDLRKRYKVTAGLTAPAGMLTALDGVSLELRRGEILGIAGESGCGKSTLGKILAGLVTMDGGQVQYHGTTVTGLSSAARADFRRQTQMIFQDPFSSLNPRMRVGDIIAEPLVIARSGDAASRRGSVEDIMAKVGLPAEHINRFPHEFSGGQRQRIGIARALAASPKSSSPTSRYRRWMSPSRPRSSICCRR